MDAALKNIPISIPHFMPVRAVTSGVAIAGMQKAKPKAIKHMRTKLPPKVFPICAGVGLIPVMPTSSRHIFPNSTVYQIEPKAQAAIPETMTANQLIVDKSILFVVVEIRK